MTIKAVCHTSTPAEDQEPSREADQHKERADDPPIIGGEGERHHEKIEAPETSEASRMKRNDKNA